MLHDCDFSQVALERLCFFLGCLGKVVLCDCDFSLVASERLCFMTVVFPGLHRKGFAS